MTNDQDHVLWRWMSPPLKDTFDPSKPFSITPHPVPYTSTIDTLEAILANLGSMAMGVSDVQRHRHWPESPSGEWQYDVDTATTVLRADDLHRHFQRYHPAHLARRTHLLRLGHAPEYDIQPLITTPSGGVLGRWHPHIL